MSKPKPGPHPVLRSHYSPSLPQSCSRATPKTELRTLKEPNRSPDLCCVMFTADPDSGLPCLYFHSNVQCLALRRPLTHVYRQKILINLTFDAYRVTAATHFQCKTQATYFRNIYTREFSSAQQYLRGSQRLNKFFLEVCNVGYARLKME